MIYFLLILSALPSARAQDDQAETRWIGLGVGVYDGVKYPDAEGDLYESALLEVVITSGGSITGRLSWFHIDQDYQMSIQGHSYAAVSQLPDPQAWHDFDDYDIVQWLEWTITDSPNEAAYLGLTAHAIVDTNNVLVVYFDEAAAFGQDIVAVGFFLTPVNELSASDLEGTWHGTLTQGGSRDFDFVITFETLSDQTLEGTSRIEFESAFGLMELQARIIGSELVFKERRILEEDIANSSVSGWCIKKGTLYLTVRGDHEVLEGRWRAPNCVPGAVTLVKES